MNIMKRASLILIVFVSISLYILSSIGIARDTESVTMKVTNSVGDFIDGHIDILVLRSDFEGELVSSINVVFLREFPEYESFDYLEDDEWISYCAYVEDAHCTYSQVNGYFIFGSHDGEYERLDDVKFIHINGDGDVVKESKIYDVPNSLFFQSFSNYNTYDETSNEFQIDFDIVFADTVALFASIILGVVILISIIRIIVALIMKVRVVNLFGLFLYFVIVHFFTFALLAGLVFNSELVEQVFDTIDKIYAFAASFLVIEMILTFILFVKKITVFKYLLYMVVSYISFISFFGLLYFVLRLI